MVNKKDFAMRKTYLSYFHEQNTRRERKIRRKERLTVPAFVI